MIENEKDPDKANDHAISQRKLEANRQNAQLSTGPRTERGKMHSRRNPLKHGLFASVLLVKGAEDPDAYKKLLHDLSQEYEAIGNGGYIWVEALAGLWWQQRRILQWQASIIRKQAHLPVDVSGVLDEEETKLALGMPSLPELEALRRYQATIQADIRFVVEQLNSELKARKGKNHPAPANGPLAAD